MESNSRKPAAAPAMIEHRCRAQVQADHMADATPMTLSEIDADLAIVASIQRQMWNRAHVAKRTGQRESAKELFEQSRLFGRLANCLRQFRASGTMQIRFGTADRLDTPATASASNRPSRMDDGFVYRIRVDGEQRQ